MSLGNLFPDEGKGKNRIQAVSPNDNAVVLMVKADDIALLLGSDLEKHGWVRITRQSWKANPDFDGLVLNLSENLCSVSDTCNTA